MNRVSIEDIRRKEHYMERQHFKRPNDDALIGSQQVSLLEHGAVTLGELVKFLNFTLLG